VGGLGIIDLLSGVTGFLSSNGEAKRALKENSIRINKEVVGAEHLVSTDDLLNGKQLLIQRGKKNYFLVNAK